MTNKADIVQTKLYDNKHNTKCKLTATETEIINYINTYNLLGGINYLYDVVSLTNKYKYFGLHKILTPDYLHTLIKGAVEFCISWIIICIKCIKQVDKTHYGNNIAILDKRIQQFNIHLSLLPFKMINFNKGISPYVKKSSNSSSQSNIGTGLMSGGLEGWKLRSLLLQLMFCIGVDSTIVPNTKKMVYK